MEGELLQAITECRGEGVRFAWKWPRVQVPEFTSRALSLLPGLVSSGLLEVMIEGAMYADSIGAIAPCIRVSGGPDLNIFNACTVRTLLPDCAGFTLSPELSGEDIADLCSRLDDTPGIGVIVQGNIPAMITADGLLDVAGKNTCQKKILYAISDATGRIFPVHPDPWGRTQILNAAELCLIDYLPALARVGVETFIIDARWRGPSYASEMISLYLEALEEKQWIKGEFPSSPAIPGLKGRVRALAQGGITAGHYLRGLSPE
jgi:putative protease